MKIALDTNRYRDFCLGDPVVLDRLQLAEQIFLPFDFDHLPHLSRID